VEETGGPGENRQTLAIHFVYIPDLSRLLFDSECKNSETAFEPNGVIDNNGSVYLVTVDRFETNNCKTKQHGGTECSFKFGSWTYSAYLLLPT
jgi:hypothetical protein